MVILAPQSYHFVHFITHTAQKTYFFMHYSMHIAQKKMTKRTFAPRQNFKMTKHKTIAAPLFPQPFDFTNERDGTEQT